jgi:hypothetical protein
MPECLPFITPEPDNCKRTYQIFDRIEQLNIGMRKEKNSISLIREAKSGKRELHWTDWVVVSPACHYEGSLQGQWGYLQLLAKSAVLHSPAMHKNSDVQKGQTMTQQS